MLGKLLLSAALLLVCAESPAQIVNAEIPAYVALHKKTGPVTFTRSVVEEYNKDLHRKSSESAVEVKEASDSLGLYYQAFNWVDIVYQSLRFGYNVRNTYNVTKERIEGIARLLDEYVRDVADTRTLTSDDQEVLDIGRELYDNVKSDVESVTLSITTIIGYAGAKVPCTTYSLLTELKVINGGLDLLQKHLNRAYTRLYVALMLRKGWHWKGHYLPESRVTICEKALERWHDSAVGSMSKASGD